MHAFLSPSGYHWIRYDEEKLAERWRSSVAAKRGTEFHELAHELIRLKVKLPKIKKTINLFVNDVLGNRMESEQPLVYSVNCFGTADAIGFRTLRGIPTLQIYDLKMGETPAKVDQLLVYAALFCHEYGVKPFDIAYDLRIYQFDDAIVYEVDPVDIAEIMATIVAFDKKIEEFKTQED